MIRKQGNPVGQPCSLTVLFIRPRRIAEPRRKKFVKQSPPQITLEHTKWATRHDNNQRRRSGRNETKTKKTESQAQPRCKQNRRSATSTTNPSNAALKRPRPAPIIGE